MSAAEDTTQGTQNAALSGPRGVEQSFLQRLVSRAMALDIPAFVVPGPEILRAHGLDLRAAGFSEAATPRHASVLVVVGGPPRGIAEAATVAYAQMPRPRAVLAIGSSAESLPTAPDVSVEPAQETLESGVEELRRRFAEHAFDARAEDFEAAALETEVEYACPMHPEVVQSEPGSCPKCGMDLVAQEAGGNGHDHGDHGHGGEPGEEQEEPSEEPADAGEDDDIPSPVPGDDFMSMLEMTEGAPRGSDGLQMEWVRTPFGPLFPGLPGGLKLAFTLGGDAVERVECGSVAGGRTELTGPAGPLPETLRSLDPLSPVSYRLLALRALESAAGIEAGEETMLARVAALERERAASHLSWLSGFARMIGYEWLARRAGELQLAIQKMEAGEVAGLCQEAERLTRRIERTPLLRRKLAGIGVLPGESDVAGPVARAAGLSEDARIEEDVYLALGFEPVVRSGGDALSRLRVRLDEIRQSLTLAESVDRGERHSEHEAAFPEDGWESVSGSSAVTVETPRGAASLSLTLEDGEVRGAGLQLPSEAHLRLVEEVTLQREVGDALVGVASLDLSPWGLADEEAG